MAYSQGYIGLNHQTHQSHMLIKKKKIYTSQDKNATGFIECMIENKFISYFDPKVKMKREENIVIFATF